MESGTPNTPGIAGLCAGVKFIQETGLEKIRRHEQELTDYLVQGLEEIEGVILYGPCDSRRQTAVVSFNIKGRDCGEVSFLLDQKYGILSRSGCIVLPGTQDTGDCEGWSLPRSPGYFNTLDDMEKVVRLFTKSALPVDC